MTDISVLPSPNVSIYLTKLIYWLAVDIVDSRYWNILGSHSCVKSASPNSSDGLDRLVSSGVETDTERGLGWPSQDTGRGTTPTQLGLLSVSQSVSGHLDPSLISSYYNNYISSLSTSVSQPATTNHYINITLLSCPARHLPALQGQC